MNKILRFAQDDTAFLRALHFCENGGIRLRILAQARVAIIV